MNEHEKQIIIEFADCVNYVFVDDDYADEWYGYVAYGADEIKQYCIDYGLSFEEIRMVFDLFKDIDFNIGNYYKITLELKNTIFYFYSKFKDVNMTQKYIDFLETMKLDCYDVEELEHYINDIIYCIKKNGIQILEELTEFSFLDSLERIVELNANTQ